MMAAQDDKSFSQYLDRKHPFGSPPVDFKVGQTRKRRLIWIIMGAILLYTVFKLSNAQLRWQRELTRPHRIPPKAAEQTFLCVLFLGVT